MKIEKIQWINVLIFTFMFTIFMGCEGSSSSPKEYKVGKGTYIDSAVSGISYICGEEKGVTDENGQFKFEVGTGCTFFIKDIELRKVAKGLLRDKVVIFEDHPKVAQFLQTLDNDGDPSNGITIAPKVIELLEGTLPESKEELEALVKKIREKTKKDPTLNYRGHVVTEEDAKKHIEETRQDLDKTPPTIALNGVTPMRVNQNSSFEDPGITATDDYYSTDEIVITTSGTVDTTTPASYTITYTATDGASNSATATRVVNVVDSIKPVITLTGDANIVLNVGDTYNEQGATVTDNVDTNLQVVIGGDSVNTATAGTYVVTYDAIDTAGNSAIEVKRTVVVKVKPIIETPDRTKPVITLNGKSSIELTQGTAYQELGATATDNRDGTVSVTITGTVNINSVGTYTITYTAKDKAGNKAKATRTVKVVLPPDRTKPVITLNGKSSIELTQGTAYQELGATATDNRDGTVSVITTGTVDINSVGTYTITYTAKDKAGNKAKATRTVKVVLPLDRTKPVITLNGNSNITLNVGDTYNEEGATVTDNVDTNLQVVIGGDSVNTATAGTYVVTYDATDKAGNIATQVTRTVEVSVVPDTTRPVIIPDSISNVAPTITSDSFQKVFYLDDNSTERNVFTFPFKIADIDNNISDLNVTLKNEIVHKNLPPNVISRGFSQSRIICDMSGNCGARIAFDFTREDGMHPSMRTKHYITVSDGDKNVTNYVEVWFAPVKPELSGDTQQTIGFTTKGEHRYKFYSFKPYNAGNKAESWSIANKPLWADFNTSTGLLSGTPLLDQNGTYANIQITATNDRGSDTFSFSIQVRDKMPSKAFEIKDYYGVEINKYYDTFLTVDWLPSGQSVAISSSGYAGQASHSGFTVNGNNNVTSVSNGDIVRIGHLSSNEYNTELRTTITIGNDSDDFITRTKASTNAKLPLIVGSPNGRANVHEVYSYTPQISTDTTRFAPVTKPFEIQNKPDWATFDPQTGTLSGTPITQGVYKDVKIIAYGDNGLDDITFNITVENNGPSLSSNSLSLENENLDFTYNDNSDWRGKISEVSMYSCYEQTTPIVLDSSDYSFAEGTLTLHVSTSSNVALHTPIMGGGRLIIKATGYSGTGGTLIDYIENGQYGIKATISSTLPLKEDNLNGVQVNITLSNYLAFKDSSLDKNNFSLIQAPEALTISSINYVDETHATVTLSYNGIDFDTNQTIQISISSDELNTPCAEITTNELNIEAVKETPFANMLYPNDPSENAKFGYSVDDFNGTIAVGAYTGVYIFTKDSDGNYTQKQKIASPSGSVNFGNDLALDGDYLVISDVHYRNNNNESDGIVYIYKKDSNGIYTYLRSLKTPSQEDNIGYQAFGNAVSMSGNMLLVGAFAADDKGLDGAGRAYLYKKDTNDNFSLVSTLSRANAKSGDFFGNDVAIKHGLSGTSEENNYYILVGSHVLPIVGDNKSELGAGFANYYVYKNGTLSSPVVIQADDTTELSKHFGSSVALDGNIVVIGSSDKLYTYARGQGNALNQRVKLNAGAGGINGHDLDISFTGINNKARYVIVAHRKTFVSNSDVSAYSAYEVNLPNNSDLGYSVAVSGFEVVRGSWSNSDLVSRGGAALVSIAYNNITNITQYGSNPPAITAPTNISLSSNSVDFTFNSDSDWENAITQVYYKAGENAQYVLLSANDYTINSGVITLNLASSSNVALHTPYTTNGSLLIKANGYKDRVVTISGVSDGTNSTKATISSSSPLKEDNLNGAIINIVLSNNLKFVQNSLSLDDFILVGAPNGVSVNSFTKSDDTHAQITLAFDGTDFDDNTTFSFEIAADGLNISTSKVTNSLVIEAVLEENTTTIPAGATILNDINITVSTNSTTRIDTGIDQNSNVTIYTNPSHGIAQAFLVANESWNLDYNTSSCYIGTDSFIYKKDSNEYGKVNIIINGADFSSEQNRTISTKENIPLHGIKLSSISSTSIKTNPLHGNLYTHFEDENVSKFDYYPNRNFSGIDFFDYDINQTINSCYFDKTVRVTINVEPKPPLKVAVAFPDDNGDCKVAMTDGNNSLTYSNDTLYYEACFANNFIKFHKVLDKFEYKKGENILHSIHQNASIVDLNSHQRNTFKTSQIFLDEENYGTMNSAYVFKYQYYQYISYQNPVLHYTENLIYSAYTPVTNENNDIEAPIFGKLPWDDHHEESLFDIVADPIDGDRVITSYAGIDNYIYFVGYDGANGNGISLACTELVNGVPSYHGACQGIQLYLNAFDDDAHDTSLIFTNSDIVSVLNKSLVFTYTHGVNQPKTKLFISDGEIDYFDSDEINKHVKLISDNQYYKLNLQKPKIGGYTVFYKGKNKDTNKTEIGYIKEEHSGLENRYYLNPNQANLLLLCEDNGNNNDDDDCSEGLRNRTFTLEKLYEYQDVITNLKSKWLVVDNSHIYVSERNNTSNGDILNVIDKTNNTITYINISLLNINTARVFDIKMIGNYVYLLIGKSTKGYPISLWKIDPTDNSATQIEGYQDNRYIRVFNNSVNHGNGIVYSVMTINDNEDEFTDFELYSYDSSSDTKKQISTQDYLNYP